ncbi:MAG: hypothetical protein OHM77_10455 [Candidatus Nitricoxidivorans perseverans]|uniref:Uncharacterized protein n=1 Tax=Candidatus Nitricoxidivorans perseverans TaxID=2975601 RepID=A0AA49ITH2_9PROT|nr:MAG: hypothetical protein OHM77_10455 [Candidatus Nitricoxidivorans perseverans]
MKTVLVHCWEAGAAAALAPVIRLAIRRGHRVVSTSLDPGASLLSRRFDAIGQIAMPDIRSGAADIALVGLGHPRNSAGTATWSRIADLLPSVGVLDHWKGLERFFPERGGGAPLALPELLCVPDDVCAQALAGLGMPGGRLRVTGHPRLDCDLDPGAAAIRTEARRRLGFPEGQPVHVLASETVHDHGFFDACGSGCHPLERHPCGNRELLDRLIADASDGGALLVARPHPQQRVPAYGTLRVISWAEADDEMLIAAADRVYGLSSLFLALAQKRGVEVVNIAPWLDAWRPEQAFLSVDLWNYLTTEGDFSSGGGGHPPGSRDAVTAILGELEGMLS